MPPLNRFDSIAPIYDGLASLAFGQSIKKAQRAHLGDVPARSDVLVLGGGTGKWLGELLGQDAGCRVWYVEASLKMIHLAKKNLKGNGRVVFIHGTHLDIPDRKFDVVIAHFFVDLFNGPDLEKLSGKVATVLKKNGKWIVADFVNRKYWHGAMLWLMYLFFHAIGALDHKGLPEWDGIIQRKSFVKENTMVFYKGFIESVLYSH